MRSGNSRPGQTLPAFRASTSQLHATWARWPIVESNSDIGSVQALNDQCIWTGFTGPESRCNDVVDAIVRRHKDDPGIQALQALSRIIIVGYVFAAVVEQE